MTCDQVNALGSFRVSAFEHGVNVHELCGLGDAPAGGLNKIICTNLQTSTACVGVALQFRLDPLARSANAFAGSARFRIGGGEGTAISEADQLFYSGLNLSGRNIFQCRYN